MAALTGVAAIMGAAIVAVATGAGELSGGKARGATTFPGVGTLLGVAVAPGVVFVSCGLIRETAFQEVMVVLHRAH